MQNITLRPFQKKALSKLEKNIHLICIAATGSGKSLIYQLEALKKNQRTLLITPLIALGRQQAFELRALGASVKLTCGEHETLEVSHSNEKSEIWIMSPEKIFSAYGQKTRESIRKFRPTFLVVDECHCVFEWGEDFRKSFSLVPSLVDLYKIKKSLWLSATLPKQDLSRLLQKLPRPTSVLGKFSLPKNLEFKISKLNWVQRYSLCPKLVKREQGAGIIFVGSRNLSERLHRYFSGMGIKSAPYHAGLSKEERINVESLLKQEKLKVVIATSAFGMGMNFSHLKWCICFQLPPTLLSLTQQIGRVGRDYQGKAIVFWENEDFLQLSYIVHKNPNRKKDLIKLRNFVEQSDQFLTLLEEYFV